MPRHAGRHYPMTMERYKPWPLDIRLLELLPDQGLIGGVHHAGRTAHAMMDEINQAAGQALVTGTQIGTRLRVMREIGLTQNFPATGGRVWAKTPAGKKWLASHRLAEQPNAEQVEEEDDDTSDPAAVVELDAERRAAHG